MGSNTTLEMIQKNSETIENEKKIVTAEIYVAKGNNGSILGYDTCIQMQFVPKIAIIVSETEIDKLYQKYPIIYIGRMIKHLIN